MAEIVVVVAPIVIVFFLANLITSIVFTYYFKSYELDKSIIPILENELNSKLIYSIRSADECSLEGEEILVLGTFDGSVPKCYCEGFIYNRTCSDIDTGCTSYMGEKKDYIKFNSKYICIKKTGLTYKELLNNNQIIAKGCDDGYKTCGFVDTLNNYLCVKEEDPCHITKIDIENTENMNEALLKKYENYKSIDMGNGFKMYYLNEGNENNKIISVIQLGEDYPCVNPTEKIWKSYDPNYKNQLEQCSSINGKRKDDRYEKYSIQTTKQKLYEDNDLYGYINTDIKRNTIYINLYGRTLYGFKKNVESIDIKELKETQDYVNKYSNILNVTRTVMYVIVGLPLFCMAGGAGVAASAGGGGSAFRCSGDGGIGALVYIGGCLVIAGGLGNFCIFIYSIIILIKHNKIKSIISPYIDSSDEYISEIIEGLLDGVSSNFTFSLAIIILTSISFIVLVGGGLALISSS